MKKIISSMSVAAMAFTGIALGVSAVPASAVTKGTTVFDLTLATKTTTVKITTAGNYQIRPYIKYYTSDNTNAQVVTAVGSWVKATGASSTATAATSFRHSGGFDYQ